MFEELYEEVRDVQNRVLEEFVQGLPSTFIEADFEVEQLRLQVCAICKHKALTTPEVFSLSFPAIGSKLSSLKS